MPKLKKSPKSNKKSSAKTPTLNLKEELAQKRQAAKARKEFISLLTSTTGCGLFLGMILFFVGGVKLAAPGVLGIIVITLCYKYPRPALFAFIIYLPFAGTIIYYLGNSPILQLAKDAFYAPVAIAVWQTCKKQNQPFIVPQGIRNTFFILFTCCMLTLLFINGGQQLKPAGGDFPIGLGLLGLKVFIGYLPIITCIYYLIRNQQDFWFLSRLQIILIITCCILGIIQYFLLTIGVCKGTVGVSGDALFKATLDARCYVGGALLYTPEQGVIRLPGTFVAPWQWAWFLISSTFFTFATIFSDKSIIWRLIGLVALLLVVVNAVICGQRISLALVPVCFILLLLFTGQLANLKKFIPLGGALAVFLFMALAANPAIVQERTESFVGRWNASPPQQFIVDQWDENWKDVDTSIGSGLGRATNSARVMGVTKLVETYYPKVLYEVGIVGLLAFILFVTSLTIVGFKTYSKIKNPNLRTYGASMWVFVLIISYNTYYYPLDVDPVCVYYWLAAGIIFKLPMLDKEVIEEESEVDPKNQKKRLYKK